MADDTDVQQVDETKGRLADEKRLPIARWQLVEVAFTTANVDVLVPHTLKPKDVNAVKFEVMDRNSPGSVYRGAKAPQADYIVLRSSIPGSFHIRLYIPAHYTPSSSKLATTSYVASAGNLLDGHPDATPSVATRGDTLAVNSLGKWARIAVGNGVFVADGVDAIGWTGNPILNSPVINNILDLHFGQIQFPPTQNPSSDANTLDDYEEGSWTPVFGSDGVAATGQSYSVQVGRYIKIGRKITCTFAARLSVKGTISAGSIAINGLPFTVANVSSGYGAGMVFQWVDMTTAWVSINLRVEPNTTLAYPIATTIATTAAAGPTFPAAPTEWTATSFMAGMIQYFTVN